jgi:hypothetical protein
LTENLSTVENVNEQLTKSMKSCDGAKKLRENFNKIGHWSEFQNI